MLRITERLTYVNPDTLRLLGIADRDAEPDDVEEICRAIQEGGPSEEIVIEYRRQNEGPDNFLQHLTDLIG